MDYIRKIIKRNKSLLKILGFIGVLGFIIGFFIYGKLENTELSLYVQNISLYLKEHQINFILTHLILICILTSGLILGISLIFIPLLLIWENINLGFMLRAFFEVFKFKGIGFGLLYFLLTKFLYLLLVLFLVKKILNASRAIINMFYKKDGVDTKYILLKNVKAIMLITFMIFINDLLVYFLANKLLIWFLFIIE